MRFQYLNEFGFIERCYHQLWYAICQRDCPDNIQVLPWQKCHRGDQCGGLWRLQRYLHGDFGALERSSPWISSLLDGRCDSYCFRINNEDLGWMEKQSAADSRTRKSRGVRSCSVLHISPSCLVFTRSSWRPLTPALRSLHEFINRISFQLHISIPSLRLQSPATIMVSCTPSHCLESLER